MPVSVHVPIRLRLTASRLETCLDEIEDAVGVAALRAMVRSRVAVLEPRSGYAAVTCAAPQFTWNGDVARASQPLRQEIERRVAVALTGASERARLFDFGVTRVEAPEVLPDKIFERIDPTRFDETLESYEIPSYQRKKPRKKSVRVKSKGKDPSAAGAEEPQLTFGIVFDEFPDDTTNEDFWNTFGWRVDEHFGSGRAPNVFGILYRIAGIAYPLLSIVEQRRGQVTKWMLYRFPLGLPPLDPNMGRALSITDWGSFRWTKIENTTKAIADWREGYRKSLIKHLTPRKVTGRDPEEQAKAKKELLVSAEKAVADYTAGWETKVAQFYAFKHPAGVTNYPIGPGSIDRMPPSGQCEVVALARKVAIAAEGQEGQGAGGKGKGAGGKYKLAAGQIPGFEGGVEGGIGAGIISREYEPRWPSRFPFRPGERTLFEKLDLFSPVCEPYLNEPSVIELGAGGLEIWALIQKIAVLLEMEPCEYAANFAINAAKVLGGRAAGVGDVVTMDKAVFLEDLAVGSISEAGEIVFKPVPAPALQYLQELARMVRLLDELFGMIRKTLFARSELVASGYFIQKFDEALEASIVWIYLYTCQIVLLQQLTASRENILQRLEPRNFDAYAQLTEILLSEVLSDQLELIRLRDAMNRFTDKRLGLRLDQGDETRVFGEDPDFAPTWNAYYDLEHQMRVQPSLRSPEETLARHEKWTQLYRALDEFRAREDLHFRLYDLDHVVRSRAKTRERLGHIRKRSKDGKWAICDSRGDEWSFKELDTAIGVRQKYIENQDPILKHLKFRTDVAYLAKDRTRVKPFLQQLLNELLEKNAEVRANTLADPKWAFEHSKIEKPEGKTTYFGYQSGLHLMAHEALKDAFVGTVRYSWSLNHLYDHQLGWISLRDTFLFVGITALSILCPPLGAIAGLAEAIWRYGEAQDLEAYYGALIDPKDIVSRAEVEAQMFVAQLGLALSIVPVAGKIASATTRTIKSTVARGLTGGVRTAIKQQMDELAEQMTRALGTGLAVELAAMPVMMKVMETLLEPMVDRVIREVEVGLPLAPEEET